MSDEPCKYLREKKHLTTCVTGKLLTLSCIMGYTTNDPKCYEKGRCYDYRERKNEKTLCDLL